MKKLWEIFKMNKSELLLTLGSMFGGMVFGGVMVALIVLLSDDADSYALMGTFMAFVVWAAIIVFVGAFSLERRFGMAVSMGETRKSFLINQWLVMAFNTLLEIVAIVVMNTAEKAIGERVYNLPCEFDVVSHMIDYRLILAALVAVPSASMFLGMLIAKFQKKAFWGIWVFWMAGSVGLSRLSYLAEENPDGVLARMADALAASAAALGMTGAALLVVFIGAVMMTVSVAVLRRQAVIQV